MTSDLKDLLGALRHPQRLGALSPATWDLVVRQADSAGLLGRIGALALGRSVEADLPKAVVRRLRAAATLAEQQQRAVRWEILQLTDALSELHGPIVLLKGAAYAAAGLPPAAGRLFSDIDILLPKDQISAAESALMLAGWNSSHHDAYDQRYYRNWMHELPPMVHIRRQTVLDVHHNILPETARIRTRPDLLIASAKPLEGHPRFSVLAYPDLILHSATHLFHEGEWEHGLRDLADLDALLRAGGEAPAFWSSLLARAAELKLGKPLYYGLRYCKRIFGTPVPDAVAQSCPERPGRLAAIAMDALFMPALTTAHHSFRHWFAGPAVTCLYVRSHWLRMPLHLLLPHLVRKAWTRRDSEPDPDGARPGEPPVAH